MRSTSLLLICLILITIALPAVISPIPGISNSQTESPSLQDKYNQYYYAIFYNVTPQDPGSGEGGNTYQYGGNNDAQCS